MTREEIVENIIEWKQIAERAAKTECQTQYQEGFNDGMNYILKVLLTEIK